MDTQIDFELTVTFQLNRLATSYKVVLERHMALADLHGGSVFILIELWKKDGLRQIDLVERIGSSAPTLNRMLTSLQKDNLIEERPEPGDKRSKRYFLTPLGRSIRQSVENKWHDLEALTLKAIKDSERPLLEDLIDRLKSAYTGEPPRSNDD